MLGYKRARCAVRQLVNTLDALKQGVKVSGSLRKDGTPSKDSYRCFSSARADSMPWCFAPSFLLPRSSRTGLLLMCCHRFVRRTVIFRFSRVRAMRRLSDMQKKSSTFKEKENLLKHPNLRIFVYFIEINLRIFNIIRIFALRKYQIVRNFYIKIKKKNI